MNAVPPTQPLLWDSQFLGFGVARVVAQQMGPAAWQQVQTAALADNRRLLYIVADPADATTAATLASVGLFVISQLVTYLADAKALVAHSNGMLVERTTRLTPALELLAWESGAFSRFRVDPQMPAHAFRGLYSEWLRKSLCGNELAREVFAAQRGDGIEIGLLTLGQQRRCADIGLLAVATANRGSGVGLQLLATAGATAQAWGFDQVQVVTQSENKVACHFYVRAGFKAVQQQDIYHCWLS